MAGIRLLCVFAGFLMGAAVVLNTATMKNFGHSIKNGHLIANTEITLFEHNCTTAPCTITQMHCPTAGPQGWYDAQVRLYIDGQPPLVMSLLDLANIGDPEHLAPPAPPPAPVGPPNYTEYFLGKMGQTCDEVCRGSQLQCSDSLNLGFDTDQGKAMQQHLAKFNSSVLNCTMDKRDWWASDQPGYVCGNDPHGNTGLCVGWRGIPSSVSCAGTYPEQCRVCHCVAQKEDVKLSADPGASDGSPWGDKLFGHTAANGGVYSTVRIPFGKSFRATLTSQNHGTFWFIVRGVEGLPVVIGDFELPASARLHLRSFEASTVPNELVTLVDIPRGTSGAVLNLRFDASSADYNYLEACMRMFADGATSPLFLSSGAEDYFLSAYYFNEGMFKTPNSGLTFFDKHGKLSAYKTHDRDPLVFDDGLKMMFRNMEVTTGCGDTQHCPNQYCRPGADPKKFSNSSLSAKARFPSVGQGPALYKTLVWVYEWPRETATMAPVPHAAARLVARLGLRQLLDAEEEHELQERLLKREPRAEALLSAYAAELEAGTGSGDDMLKRIAALLRKSLFQAGRPEALSI